MIWVKTVAIWVSFLGGGVATLAALKDGARSPTCTVMLYVAYCGWCFLGGWISSEYHARLRTDR